MSTPADSLPPAPTHRLAREIKVVRDPDDPSVRVYIDGELVPFFLSGEGIKVEPSFGQPGRVTFSLTAETILVEDRYLLGASDRLRLDHTHENDGGDA